tara:strand:- start:708 stop:1394 length:687 start_codon:yes stop_codon:yes gene_type:complete
MSKKKLLEENTVRKFMKFANIGHLAENYLEEAGMYEDEEEIEVAGDELPPEAGMEGEMGMEDEMGMEPEAEMPAEEEGAMGMDEKEQMLADVVAAVAETLGVEAAVEGAEMAPEGEEEAMDFAPAVADEEMPAAEEEEEVMEMAHPEGEMEEGAYMEEDEHMEEGMHGKKEEEEEVVEGVEVMDEDTIVQETVKRVTARLKAMKEAKKKEDLVESITSRIIDALKSKK